MCKIEIQIWKRVLYGIGEMEVRDLLGRIDNVIL